MTRLAALLMIPLVLQAQCVQCFRNAAAQQSARAQWLNLGILVLLLPTFTLLAGFCWLVYRRRKG
ncbi:MAG: hypothetical protein JNL98_26210 [Bryobacterales bacterium]|nr:hypothetical protein [Bryobacterales bacterium]